MPILVCQITAQTSVFYTISIEYAAYQWPEWIWTDYRLKIEKKTVSDASLNLSTIKYSDRILFQALLFQLLEGKRE